MQSLAMWGVMRFYNLLRIGITWKGPEIIELWQSSSDTEKCSTSQEYITTEGFYYKVPDTYSDSEDRDDMVGVHEGNSSDDDMEADDDFYCGPVTTERLRRFDRRTIVTGAGSGSDEDDSLLVAYDSNSIVSVWQKYNETAWHFVKTPTGNLTLLCFVICMIEFYAEIILVMK